MNLTNFISDISFQEEGSTQLLFDVMNDFHSWFMTKGNIYDNVDVNSRPTSNIDFTSTIVWTVIQTVDVWLNVMPNRSNNAHFTEKSLAFITSIIHKILSGHLYLS